MELKHITLDMYANGYREFDMESLHKTLTGMFTFESVYRRNDYCQFDNIRVWTYYIPTRLRSGDVTRYPVTLPSGGVGLSARDMRVISVITRFLEEYEPST